MNCADLEEWKNADFKSFKLSQPQALLLNIDLLNDSKDVYYKGVISLIEGIKAIENKLYSWATVKLYYALFYFIKCNLNLNGVALIRHKSLFYLKAQKNEKPISKANKKYNSDHSGTINHYIDLFSSDILLSQSIGDSNAFEWIMNKREQVNYRERTFNEPNYSFFWQSIAKEVEKNKLQYLITSYINDEFILCFQAEHSILAIPIKKAIFLKQKFEQEKLDPILNPQQIEFCHSINPSLKDIINSLFAL